MKIFLRFLLVSLLAAFPAVCVSAKEKPFYDSKSWYVMVFGDASYLKDQEMGSKVMAFDVKIPVFDGEPTDWNCRQVARMLTEKGYGKLIVDALTKNGTTESYLRKFALKNKQRQDEELGIVTSRVEAGEDVDNLIAEQYLPVLQHCYIVAQFKFNKEVRDKDGNKTTRQYQPVLFKIDIDENQAFDIMSSLGPQENYDKLSFNVSYATNEYLYNDIIKDVPDMAVRGVITRRHPARISIGKNAGVKKGDLVSVYSQRQDKNGESYSKRISRARVCGVWDDEAQVNFEANTAGNRKNGDVVVVTNDNKLRAGLLATYSPHIWGGRLVFDYKAGFTRAGIIHHILMDMEYAMTDNPKKCFTVVENLYDEYSYDKMKVVKAPWFLNAGVGYGIGKTFLGFFDIMPFFLVQYEFTAMMSKKLKGEIAEKVQSGGVYASALRIPLGVRFSFNTGYPVKVALELGYNFNFMVGKKENANYSGGKKNDVEIVKQALGFMNAKRDGVFVNLGFMF